MQLRRGYTPRAAGLGNHLPAPHGIAPLYEDFLGMGVCTDPAILVTQQHKVAIAFQLIAGIGHHAGLRRTDVRSFRHCNVDALVARATRLRAILRDHPATHRPTESGPIVAVRNGAGLCLADRPLDLLNGLRYLRLILGKSGALSIAFLHDLAANRLCRCRRLKTATRRNTQLLADTQAVWLCQVVVPGNLVGMNVVFAANGKQGFTGCHTVNAVAGKVPLHRIAVSRRKRSRWRCRVFNPRHDEPLSDPQRIRCRNVVGLCQFAHRQAVRIGNAEHCLPRLHCNGSGCPFGADRPSVCRLSTLLRRTRGIPRLP